MSASKGAINLVDKELLPNLVPEPSTSHRPTHTPSTTHPRSGLTTPDAVWRADVATFYDSLDPDRVHPLRHYYYRRLAGRLTRVIPPGCRVLDVGCGTGDLLAALRPSVGMGVDLSRRLVTEARRRHPSLRFQCLAAEQLHQIADTFDYVVISQTIGEIYDVPTVFRAVQRVCHDRTRLVIVHDNRLWQPFLKMAEWLGLKPRSPERNWLPSEEVENLLRLSGFEAIRCLGLTPFPIGIPVVSELVNRWGGNCPGIHHLGLNYLVIARSLNPLGTVRNRPRSVSIVVPARNESGHVHGLLERIPVMTDESEVIFVEGGSSDDTWAVIQESMATYDGPHRVRCLRQPGWGKGDAVRAGFAVAAGEVLMILDADLSVPPEELPPFYEALVQGHGEMINGSRMVYLMDPRAMRFLNLLANKSFGWLFTFLLSQRFRDTLCGTKVLRRDDYERIAGGRAGHGDFDPFGDFDLLFGAARLNLKIVDVPVHYGPRTYGTTNISRFRHGWMLLRMCLHAARRIKFV